MTLRPEERALAEAAHERVRFGNKFGRGFFIMAYSGMTVPGAVSFFQMLRDPHSPPHLVALVAGLLGLACGLTICSAFAASHQRQRDEDLVRLFEHHFPEECSWKQDEKILSEAEDIRLKAKVDSILHKAVV